MPLNNAMAACPICQRSTEEPGSERYRPFCSKRCADVDLARWLGGTYAIPAEPAPSPSAEAEED